MSHCEYQYCWIHSVTSFVVDVVNIALFCYRVNIFMRLGKNIMTLDEIKKKLEPYNLRKVAQATGLHYTTVYKYATGEVKRPDHQTMKKLEEFLR